MIVLSRDDDRHHHKRQWNTVFSTALYTCRGSLEAIPAGSPSASGPPNGGSLDRIMIKGDVMTLASYCTVI
jgi:hypothetical protein